MKFAFKDGLQRGVSQVYRLAMPLGMLVFAAGCIWVQFQAVLLPPQMQTLLGVLGVLGALIFSRSVLRWQRGRRSPWMLANGVIGALGFLALAIAWASYFGAQRVADHWPTQWEGKTVFVQGYVSTMPMLQSSGQRLRFVIESNEVSPALNGKTIALAWYGENPLLFPAQRYRMQVRVKQRHGSLNPHGFDYELWLVQRGIAGTGYLRAEPEDLNSQTWAFLPQVERFRAKIRSALYASSPSERAGRWAAALALGDQRSLNDTDWQRYNGTGTGHLLAVSGSHIMMMGALLAWLAGRWWASQAQRLLRLPKHSLEQHVMLASSAVYALLAGWELPAQRTVLMLAVAWGVYRYSARSAVWHVMACAGAVALAFDPIAVVSASFWLSYGAVALLLSLRSHHPNANQVAAAQEAQKHELIPTIWQRRWQKLRAASISQLLLTAALLPVGAVFFSQISLVSPLANAIAIPVMGWLSTPLALMAGAFALVSSSLAAVFMEMLLLVQTGVDVFLDWLLGWPYAQTTVPQLPPLLATVCLGAALACVVCRDRLRVVAAVCVLVLIGLASAAPTWLRPNESGWKVVFLDVGQGMAVVVHSQGKTLLFDTGPRYGVDSDGAARMIVPYLNAVGVRQLDHVVLSHADDDHTGGARSLMARMPVAQWWVSLPAEHRLRQFLPVNAQPCKAGQQWHWAGLQLMWLHPLPEVSYEVLKPNAVSCVLKVSDGQHSVLLTGDIESAQEAQLVQTYGQTLRSNVLLAPHHGSKTSSSLGFLEAVGAEHVVMQTGYRNRFGHPHPSVVARYREQGINQWRSDADGAVIAHFDNAKLSMSAWRTQARRYWHTSLPVFRGAADGSEF